jgi:PhnB protein
MTAERSKATAEAQIRKLVDQLARAIRDKDVEAVMACYASDILTFDLAPPLQHAGREVIKEGLKDWFPTWDGPIGLEIRDLSVVAGGAVAYCTSLNRMTGTKTDGEKPDLWFRATYGLRKEGGAWKIAHEHASTPFYMDGSFKAAVDLKP